VLIPLELTIIGSHAYFIAVIIIICYYYYCCEAGLDLERRPLVSESIVWQPLVNCVSMFILLTSADEGCWPCMLLQPCQVIFLLTVCGWCTHVIGKFGRRCYQWHTHCTGTQGCLRALWVIWSSCARVDNLPGPKCHSGSSDVFHIQVQGSSPHDLFATDNLLSSYKKTLSGC